MLANSQPAPCVFDIPESLVNVATRPIAKSIVNTQCDHQLDQPAR